MAGKTKTKMEPKPAWNLGVYKSVAEKMEELIDNEYRGEKGLTVSAACLMFITSSPEQRHGYVRLIKRAEADGWAGTILEAAQAAMADADNAALLGRITQADPDEPSGLEGGSQGIDRPSAQPQRRGRPGKKRQK